MNESPNKDGGWVPGRRKEVTFIEEKSLFVFEGQRRIWLLFG
jgi:hypothetical protein